MLNWALLIDMHTKYINYLFSFRKCEIMCGFWVRILYRVLLNTFKIINICKKDKKNLFQEKSLQIILICPSSPTATLFTILTHHRCHSRGPIDSELPVYTCVSRIYTNHLKYSALSLNKPIPLYTFAVQLWNCIQHVEHPYIQQCMPAV